MGWKVIVAPSATRNLAALLCLFLAGGFLRGGEAGWVKYAGNPVLGGKYGTCFDVAVLKEGETYRMWLSWRPKKSLALVESKDGMRWSEPSRIVLGPNPATGWEEDINRPVVVKRADGYHLWYTGQAKGRSAIGYATARTVLAGNA